MKLRLISDFLRNGAIGGVSAGTDLGDVEKLLGVPSSIDHTDIGPSIYYGDVRILGSGGQVWFIEIDDVTRKGRKTFVGNKSIQIYSEGLRPDLTRKEVIELVGEHGIKTILEPRHSRGPRPDDDHVEWRNIQVPSGAEIVFERFGLCNPTPAFKLIKLYINYNKIKRPLTLPSNDLTGIF